LNEFLILHILFLIYFYGQCSLSILFDSFISPIKRANSRARGFLANTLCQLINLIYKEAGIQVTTSHSGRRGFIIELANHSVGIKVIMKLAAQAMLMQGTN